MPNKSLLDGWMDEWVTLGLCWGVLPSVNASGVRKLGEKWKRRKDSTVYGKGWVCLGLRAQIPSVSWSIFPVTQSAWIHSDEWNWVREEKRFCLTTFPKLKLLCKGGLKDRVRENPGTILVYKTDFQRHSLLILSLSQAIYI